MSVLVADCPRCGSRRITFDLRDAIFTATNVHGWQNWYEAFCTCRQCEKSTVFVLKESVDGNHDHVHKKGLTNIPGAVNKYVKVEGIVSLKDRVSQSPPAFVPDNVAMAFREGATCLAVGCYNAAGAMFRLCVDLTTKPMLPAEGDDSGPKKQVRRSLGLRLQWLFESDHLDPGLRSLADCLKEDGNDGAHDGTLTREEATDLLDFAHVLLERVYTDPGKLEQAEKRRLERRAQVDK